MAATTAGLKHKNMERQEEKISRNNFWTSYTLIHLHTVVSILFHVDAMLACYLWASTYTIGVTKILVNGG